MKLRSGSWKNLHKVCPLYESITMILPNSNMTFQWGVKDCTQISTKRGKKKRGSSTSRNMSIPGCSVVNNLPANVGDWGSIPGWGTFSGGGNGNPLQYSCLENSMGRAAWQATVHRVTVGHDWAHTGRNTLLLPFKILNSINFWMKEKTSYKKYIWI